MKETLPLFFFNFTAFPSVITSLAPTKLLTVEICLCLKGNLDNYGMNHGAQFLVCEELSVMSPIGWLI